MNGLIAVLTAIAHILVLIIKILTIIPVKKLGSASKKSLTRITHRKK